MQTKLLKIPGVRDGREVEVGPHLLTPAAIKAGQQAKNARLRKGRDDLDGVPDEFKTDVIADVRREARIAEGSAMLHVVLKALDPSLERASLESTVEALPFDVYLDIMEAIMPDEETVGRVQDKVKRAQGKDSDPLAQTSSS